MVLTPREKLVIIYRESTRAQRLRQATKLGFTGKPENKLRSYRRLIQTDLTQTQKFNVTSYFKPYITKNDYEDFWMGETPPIKLNGMFSIRGYGIGIFKEPEWILQDLRQPSGERKTYLSNDIETVFRVFQQGINDLFERDKDYEIFGLSFNKRGFPGLIREAEEASGEIFEAPKLDGVKIDLVPASSRIIEVDGKKKSGEYTPARDFPKRNRAKREAYINRAFGQLTKEGGRLNDFKTLD
jgi:hypothetical protein